MPLQDFPPTQLSSGTPSSFTPGGVIFAASNGSPSVNGSSFIWDNVNIAQRIGPSYAEPLVSSFSINSNGSAPTANFNVALAQNTASAPSFNFIKARGSLSSPADVGSGDFSMNLETLMYSGGTWFKTCAFRYAVDGSFTSGQRPPGRIEWYTNLANTAQTKQMVLSSAGLLSLPKVAPKASPWADVTHPDFGAVGDDSTDDTTAIQAAINSGANVIYFPPGKTFLISATLTLLDKDQTLIFGAGAAIDLKNNAVPIFTVPASTLSARRQYTFQGGTFLGNSVAGQEIIRLADAGGYGNVLFERTVAKLIEKHVNWTAYDTSKTRQSVVEFSHFTDTPPNMSTAYWGLTPNAAGSYLGWVKLIYTDFRNMAHFSRLMNLDGDVVLTRFDGEILAPPTFKNNSGFNSLNAIDSFLSVINAFDTITLYDGGGLTLDNRLEKCILQNIEWNCRYFTTFVNCTLKDNTHFIFNTSAANRSEVIDCSATDNCVIYFNLFSISNARIVRNVLPFNGAITTLIAASNTDHLIVHENYFQGSSGTNHPVVESSGADYTSIKNNMRYAAGSSTIIGAHTVESGNIA